MNKPTNHLLAFAASAHNIEDYASGLAYSHYHVAEMLGITEEAVIENMLKGEGPTFTITALTGLRIEVTDMLEYILDRITALQESSAELTNLANSIVPDVYKKQMTLLIEARDKLTIDIAYPMPLCCLDGNYESPKPIKSVQKSGVHVG